MVSADGRWVLVLNGEIYDHREHRRRLEGQGVRFRGHSDTEVLLELIARLGRRLRWPPSTGCSRWRVWDRRDRVLVLARDRLGEKPLYYGRVGAAFAFASELRSDPAAARLPDRSRPAGPGRVPAARVRPVTTLDPARHRQAARRVGRAGVRPVASPAPVPYWSLVEVARAGLASPLRAGDDELVDLADAALRRSVGRRIEADVPVGAFLSGGLDSSTIVALAQAVSGRPVRTFTVAVGGANDESADAAAVARHLGTDHTTLPLPELDAVALAERVATIYDEPFADPSGVPTALLCAAARAARDRVPQRRRLPTSCWRVQPLPGCARGVCQGARCRDRSGGQRPGRCERSVRRAGIGSVVSCRAACRPWVRRPTRWLAPCRRQTRSVPTSSWRRSGIRPT